MVKVILLPVVDPQISQYSHCHPPQERNISADLLDVAGMKGSIMLLCNCKVKILLSFEEPRSGRLFLSQQPFDLVFKYLKLLKVFTKWASYIEILNL